MTFLGVNDVAARYRVSPNTIHKLTRNGEIPHTRRPGFRALLFREDHLDAWDNGAPLELVPLDGGGRLVRPKEAANAAA